MAENSRDRIRVRKLKARCIIGLQAWERTTLQEVVIDYDLFLDLAPAGVRDAIDHTVNYRTLTKRILAEVEASSFQLVEAMAERIAALCLEDPRVRETRVRVSKPGALRFAAEVGVEICRGRP